MLLRWLEHDPIAVTFLIVGIGAVSLLALSSRRSAGPSRQQRAALE